MNLPAASIPTRLACQEPLARQLAHRLAPAAHVASEQVELLIVDSAHCSTATPDGAARIAVGFQDPQADASLPADCSPRELRLACQLAAQVARLRQQLAQHQRRQQQLADDARRDPLTGLLNRRAWDEQLPQSSWNCVALFDLDHFKQVNDRQGHPAGDDMLRAAGAALSSAVRNEDFLARLGGDEFGLLLQVAQPGDAQVGRSIDRIRQQVAQAGVTASAGWAHRTGAPLPALARADAALRQAKQRGRDRTEPE